MISFSTAASNTFLTRSVPEIHMFHVVWAFSKKKKKKKKKKRMESIIHVFDQSACLALGQESQTVWCGP